MNETAKAMRRRWCEDSIKLIEWKKIFTGIGIDVGCGPDKVPLEGCMGFDQKDGDANKLSLHFTSDLFDYLHASQCLEHMHNPAEAFRDWVKVVKPGGYLICTIPSWELYEGMIWPSRYNPDHKSTWSMWQKGSPAPFHCKLPEWLDQFKDVGDTIFCRLIDHNYDYSKSTLIDQTWHECDGIEAFIEFLFRKK